MRRGWFGAAFACAAAVFSGCAKIEPLDLEALHKGNDPIAPACLQNGRADKNDIECWTKTIREGERLAAVDFNADGVKDYLAEAVYARGATGNRCFLVFISTTWGWRYSGMISNWDRVFYFPSGRSYLLTHANCGPELYFGLEEIRDGLILPLAAAQSVILDGGECGKEEDVALRKELWEGKWTERRLLDLFKAVPAAE